MSGTSTKPYLLRALYEWGCDNGFTPFVAVWVDENTTVPRQYVKNNGIVLNIGPSASHNLQIDSQWLSFSARFSGVSHDVRVPVGNVLSIFARESGQGMGFELEKAEEASVSPTLQAVPDHPQTGAAADGADEHLASTAAKGNEFEDNGPDEPPPKTGGRPALRIVK